MPRPWKLLSVALGALLLGSLLTGLVLTLPQALHSNGFAQDTARADVPQEELRTAQDLSSAFRTVAESLRGSVVSISARVTPRAVRGGPRGNLPPGLPPGFEDLFRGFQFQQQQQLQPREGMGSGVIVSKDGYILTNNHVVAGADELAVGLSDGRTVSGEIVGTDPETDLAVIKIDAGTLRPAALGDSEAIQVGDWVLAVGSPFGLEQTVTAGIISAKNRIQGIVEGGQGFEDFLQTDAAINPGNSGGPLVNLRGEVVGINTAIVSRSGGYNGIGFAIPAAMAKPVMTQIIETGSVRRGFLGAQVADVNPQTVEEFGLDVQQGALIRGVLENQPAAKAGLQPGDVVTQIDGRPIASGTQLRNYVASQPPGAKLNFQVHRNGETTRANVTLGERTDEAMAMFLGADFLGATLEPLDAETAAQLGYDDLDSGLVVTDVQENSDAAAAGLEVGDVLLSANGEELDSVQTLKLVVQEARGAGQLIRLVVRRGNFRGSIIIR